MIQNKKKKLKIKKDNNAVKIKKILNNNFSQFKKFTFSSIEVTFLVILMGGYVTIMILRQSQYESNSRIQEIYGKDVERIEERAF